MKINDVIHGFEVVNIRHFDQLKADVYEMKHQKTHAQLLWLDRDDDNKTFSIGFKTTPTDNTGVFHILEHSVLNGSDKYPVKEPFVDLLKGSLQTFLNAMTFGDKTVYPVSSRNDQDFINLTRVYLDAVFNPVAVKNPNVFYQEGWHYEIEKPEDDIFYRGVVYNEMKGAYSSGERVASQTLQEALFPDNCYAFESGGNPDYIPDLTYEMFCANHAKYYHPTNSYIFLDGKMDIDNMLAIINDEYLYKYDLNDDVIEIEKQKPVVTDLVRKEYEEVEVEDKTIVDFGYVIGNFDDYEKSAAFSIIASVLADNNQSPLKKAILEKGLAQDVSVAISDDIYQKYIEIMINNTNEDKFTEIKDTIDEVFKDVVKNGLDKEEILACLNKMEFASKEKDFGMASKGVVFDILALSSWLYGGDPIKGIVFDEVYDSLREKVNTSYFENLIKENLIDSNHHAAVMLVPSLTLQQENMEKMSKKMVEFKKSLSENDLAELLELNKVLHQYQQSVDTPEIKQCLPKLTLDDIKGDPTEVKNSIHEVNGRTVIEYNRDTDGINYYRMHFDVSDLTLHELSQLSLLCNLLSQLPTKQHTVNEINKLKKSYIGALSASTTFVEDAHSNDYKSNFTVSFSCLDKNNEKAWQIVKEILTETLFDNENDILDIIKQCKMEMQMGMNASGHSAGMTRMAAQLSEAGVSKEFSEGYSYYQYLKQQCDEFNKDEIEKLVSLSNRIFASSRMTLSIMGEGAKEMVEKIISDLPIGQAVNEKAERKPLERVNEAIIIPSKISYAIMGSNTDFAKQYKGKMAVIRKVLGLDYLWNEVRAKNGAYGTGLVNRNKAVMYYSYRDPNPVNSVNIYKNCSSYLENFCKNDDDLLVYVIGAVGDIDPLLTNSSTMALGDGEYFNHTTFQDKCDIKEQIISMTKEEIEKMIPMFEEIAQNSTICIFGSSESIDSFGNTIVNRLEL